MPNETELSDVLSDFARTLLLDTPMQGILDHMVRRVADLLPVTSAGVTVAWNDGDPELMAGSNHMALDLEFLQTVLGEGPRWLTTKTGEPVTIPDLNADGHFPGYRAQAIAAGVRALFAFPFRVGGEVVGTLDLYVNTTGALEPSVVRAAQMLADVGSAYLVNARSRADLQEASALARERSVHDPLTGLPNRVLLLERLEHAFLRGRRSGNLTAVLFCDLDKFKGVNDAYGHRVGDELLKAVAKRLTRQLRPGDTLARLAGDEFVLVLEDVTEAEVRIIADRMDVAFADPFLLSCGEVFTKVSIGIAFGGRANERPVKVLEKADLAMYHAKREGGGRHHLIAIGEQMVRDHAGNGHDENRPPKSPLSLGRWSR
jgi:diguanylate cyclase (GGDEF)-like protein